MSNYEFGIILKSGILRPFRLESGFHTSLPSRILVSDCQMLLVDRNRAVVETPLARFPFPKRQSPLGVKMIS